MSIPAPPPVDAILVPQGAEFQAVARGLRSLAPEQRPRLIALAVGAGAVAQRLQEAETQKLLASCRHVLVMGLAGSLSPQLEVGEVVVYQDILVPRSAAVVANLGLILPPEGDYPDFPCDHDYTALLLQRLPGARSVVALSSDRLIHHAPEKLSLGQQSGAAVVDMEAIAAHHYLHHLPGRSPEHALSLGMIRVISDDGQTTLPDLSPAFRADGSIDGLSMAGIFLQNPLAAVRLIQGSLQALAILEKTTTQLLCP